MDKAALRKAGEERDRYFLVQLLGRLFSSRKGEEYER